MSSQGQLGVTHVPPKPPTTGHAPVLATEKRAAAHSKPAVRPFAFSLLMIPPGTHAGDSIQIKAPEKEANVWPRSSRAAQSAEIKAAPGLDWFSSTWVGGRFDKK